MWYLPILPITANNWVTFAWSFYKKNPLVCKFIPKQSFYESTLSSFHLSHNKEFFKSDSQ